MKKIIFASSLLLSLHASAQVGIGTAIPAASAQLEVKSSNKGFLPPRISLAGATDVTTIASPVEGLVIYNTATAGTSPNNVVPGLYVYTGGKWAQLKTENMYSADGSVSSNRTIAQGTNTVAYTSTATTGTSQFTVDGTTLNVDANNNRVGIGTATPTNNLEVSGTNGTGTGLKLPTGAASGKILVSDINGNVSWQTGSTVVYSEIHGAGNSKSYATNVKITDLSVTKADNVKTLYGASYGWDNINKQWVAPFAGKYRVTMNAYFNVDPSNDNPRVYAYKNGTILCGILSVSQPSGSTDICTSTSAIVDLAKNDWVEFRAGPQLSKTIKLYMADYHTFVRVESVE